MPRLSRVKGWKAALGTQPGSSPEQSHSRPCPAFQGSGKALNKTLADPTCHESYCGDTAGGGGPSKMGSWILRCAGTAAGHMESKQNTSPDLKG